MTRLDTVAACGMAACAIALGAVSATPDICDGGPRSDWLSDDRIRARLSQLGYPGNAVLSSRDDCIEAKVVQDGERFAIYLEPLTGEVALIKHR
ncbi:PepSY domain-containing protein [Amaricoccus macauensis]|uniref:PepSY domain-containing protein n=1 Tax=Amaricoccus macauensis TaxID=57001 RepID=UPI003C7D057A